MEREDWWDELLDDGCSYPVAQELLTLDNRHDLILWLTEILEENHQKEVTEIIGKDVFSQWENLAYEELTTDDIVA